MVVPFFALQTIFNYVLILTKITTINICQNVNELNHTSVAS